MGAKGGSSPLVRVLVLYTPAAEASGMNMSDLSNTAIGQWVMASINSAVISGLEIAGIEPFNFVETTNMANDVTDLKNNINAQQLRDQFEADIVLLFTDGSYFSRGRVAAIGPSDNDAYGIVQVANATSTITFSHEAAHLFGARHQNDPETGDAHGHDWQTGWLFWINKYGSVMRTSASGRTRVLHFSNPKKTHEGKATGVSNISFNARVINVNGQIVEDFRYTQPSLTTSIYGPASANDGDALFFSSGTSNGQPPYTYIWEADTGSGYFTVGYTSTLNLYHAN
ncbi:MAG: hypothetical protein IIC74_02970 [Bacteroidetes bacterium]|nr:hypothetical protein [Bacteroidota bacterium]